MLTDFRAGSGSEAQTQDARTLRKDGFRPGDPEWEGIGISSFLAKPRIAAAATGLTPEGDPVVGDYKFTDEFPIAQGFEENIEFFDLTYQDAQLVELDMAFAAIAPLLWMRAGGEGLRIDERASTFTVADTYAILFNVDAAKALEDGIKNATSLRIVYVVTDDEKQFQMIASGFRHRVEVVQLYESYLRTFEINTRME